MNSNTGLVVEKWLFKKLYCVIIKNEINKYKIKKDNFNILIKRDVKKKIILIRKQNLKKK